MDYKEKCEQLTKFIKDLYPFMSDYCKEKTEGMLPELKESEDERIRKEILDCFKTMKQQGCFPSKHKEQYDSWIAYLEKQGKYEIVWKPTKEQISAFRHFVRSIGESGYASPYDNNTKLLYSLLTDLQGLEKQSNKQKPVE